MSTPCCARPGRDAFGESDAETKDCEQMLTASHAEQKDIQLQDPIADIIPEKWRGYYTAADSSNRLKGLVVLVSASERELSPQHFVSFLQRQVSAFQPAPGSTDPSAKDCLSFLQHALEGRLYRSLVPTSTF